MRVAVNQSKQTTLERLDESLQNKLIKADASEQKKKITITEIAAVSKEDELTVKIGFNLLPSKTFFSKLMFDMFFDGLKLGCISIRIPQGSFSTNDFELTPVLDMKGIPAGPHLIAVEMYELWTTGERLCQVSKEVTVDYAPINRTERLIQVPIVKSIAGADLEVVSKEEKEIIKEIGDAEKKEAISKRDEW